MTASLLNILTLIVTSGVIVLAVWRLLRRLDGILQLPPLVKELGIRIDRLERTIRDNTEGENRPTDTRRRDGPRR